MRRVVIRTCSICQRRFEKALPWPKLNRDRFPGEKIKLKENAARERAKVFGNDVKEAVRSIFPNYDLNARTNRSVDGREREPHLYFDALMKK